MLFKLMKLSEIIIFYYYYTGGRYRAPELLMAQQHYSTPIDVWSIGCIFIEMVTGRPLFPGDSEVDQLFKIFRTLGTPEEGEDWPYMTRLPGYRATFPKYPHRQLSTIVPALCEDGISITKLFLKYHPQQRINTKVRQIYILKYINIPPHLTPYTNA